MAVANVSERDDLVKFLLEEGVDDLHSWRCAHPDIYGECSCVPELADALLHAGWHRPRPTEGGAA